MRKFGGAGARRLTAWLVALALVFGVAFAIPANDAAAQSAGKSISACSYASNWCIVQFYSDGPGNVQVTWYTKWNGYYTYDTYQQYCSGWCNATKYIRSNERADQIVIESPYALNITVVLVGW